MLVSLLLNTIDDDDTATPSIDNDQTTSPVDSDASFPVIFPEPPSVPKRSTRVVEQVPAGVALALAKLRGDADVTSPQDDEYLARKIQADWQAAGS